ncbi:YbjN domain-containing protein [Yersinia mollaretii]|uniref:YbjN domain-containing protein n=1 Tax=Yersinia mollaretii TaxID=33060 RepID=UPI0005E87EA7|nr:YbjN domain-containing protein [Yersinia mollaretii]MDN0110225.1 YbjN domain-containing protein [Yersinia mollaretii]PJE88928.1 YbjN domain-containing protein [Yersinia mollaretii]CQD34599.1 putative sensory transduction regulator [Yersinia mollaretii]CQH15271.1 putative sensory transduction regulator [Yersinia mollaretii]
MDSLIVPDLTLLRRWLDQLGISFFECDSCQALHLPHMQNFEGVFDAKIDLVDNVILFSALAEVRPTALIPLVADLSQINASSLTVKAFIDIQDDNLPKLIVCQSLTVEVGVTLAQFGYFMQQCEEQISMIILEARANDLLFIGTGEEDEAPQTATAYPVIH